MSRGRKPEKTDLRIGKFVGYRGIFFGSLALVNVIAKIVHSIKS